MTDRANFVQWTEQELKRLFMAIEQCHRRLDSIGRPEDAPPIEYEEFQVTPIDFGEEARRLGIHVEDDAEEGLTVKEGDNDSLIEVRLKLVEQRQDDMVDQLQKAIAEASEARARAGQADFQADRANTRLDQQGYVVVRAYQETRGVFRRFVNARLKSETRARRRVERIFRDHPNLEDRYW